MQSHTRSMIAASAYAIITGKKAAGLFDHAAARHLKLAAESQGDHLQGYDGDRSVRFGGTLPELYDAGDEAFVTCEIDGTTARGFDRGSATFYKAKVTGEAVALYDHGESIWFSYSVNPAQTRLQAYRPLRTRIAGNVGAMLRLGGCLGTARYKSIDGFLI